MKTTIISATLILLSATMLGQITMTGESYTKINIQNDAKVFIRQDSICTVRFTGNDNPSEAQTSVRNNTLYIEGNPDNELNITLPVLQQIKIEGRGSVTGISTFNVDELNLQIDGDGKIVLDVNANKITSKISGIGKVVLSGKAEETDFSIPGAGKIDAMQLKSTRSNVNVSGVGKCMVDVTDELNTNISGSGTVTYKTLPKKMNQNQTGIGNVKMYSDGNVKGINVPDTTRLTFGKDQVWIIGKKDSTHYNFNFKRNKIKPIWQGFEMGLNSYMDNGGTFTLSPGKENFELRVEKSVSVGLNLLQDQVELGHSNVWLFTGLGITWNNYRFASDVYLENGPFTNAIVDTSSNVGHIKSKLVAIYLTSPVMFEVFTSHKMKNAFHIGAGGIFGLRIGSHTKQKLEIDGDVSKQKVFDDFNLSTFRYGFRVAIGYGRFNVYADYYASTLFKENKGPVLYPVNAGITFLAF